MNDAWTAVEQVLESEEINHVFVEFADLNGISRSKQLTTEYFRETWESGFSMNLLLLVQTPRNEVPNGTGYGAEVNYADGLLHPDLSTFERLPWRDDAARVICDFEYQGEPVPAAPRQVLTRVLEEVANEPYDFFVGSELEFYLLEETADGEYEPATTHKHECVSWATEEIAPFYDRLAEWAPEYGIDLHSLQHEHGAGQFEILFDYGSPLAQADTTFDFRRLVKKTARTVDQYATFMAKPFGGREGSGYHLHVSAFEDGSNVFAPEKPRDGLSERGRHFVGGLLEHADALAAICTPSPNAFKRYDPDGFAPYAAAWGLDNRMAALRVPTGVPRIENRIASADANPYLVIAATLAAGLDGLDRELDPGEPYRTDPTGDAPALPSSPSESLTALESDEVLVDRLGEPFVDAYVAMKRAELEAYRDVVHPWERERYVENL